LLLVNRKLPEPGGLTLLRDTFLAGRQQSIPPNSGPPGFDDGFNKWAWRSSPRPYPPSILVARNVVMPDNEDITNAPAPDQPDDEGDITDRPRRRRRDEEDEDPYRRERDISFRKRSWIDKELSNSNIVILVIFALCCNGIALIVGIIGVLTCKEPEAKQKAMILLIVGGIVTALAVGFQCMSAVGRH
jgi:hypothetical protein